MGRLRLFLFLLVAHTHELSASEPFCFKYINNALGCADRQGCFSSWWHAEENISLEGKVALPVRFLFNSFPRYISGSCLGEGWWFPILESTQLRGDAGTVIVNGPGGFAFYLSPDPKDPTIYRSPEWRLSGRETANGGFEVTDTREGWVLRYMDGRLQEAISPKGDELRWNYERGRVMTIGSPKRGELLSARYNGEGMLARVDLAARKYWIEFDYTPFPKIESGPEKGTGTRLVPSLGAVKDSAGFHARVHYVANPERRTQEMSVSYTQVKKGIQMEEANTTWRDGFSNKDLRKGMACTWTAGTGHMLSDPTHTYAVSFPEPTKFAHAKIIRTGPTGKFGSYCYDRRTGQCEEREEDGTISTTFFIVARGPSYGRMKSYVIQPGDGAAASRQAESFEAKYDEKGRRVWEVRHRTERTYLFDDQASDPYEAVKTIAKDCDGTIHYHDRDYKETRRESSDGTWTAFEHNKRGLLTKITESSGRVLEINYGPDDKTDTEYLNGNLIQRRVKLSSGKEYQLHWGENEKDPFNVQAAIDLSNDHILSDEEIEKVVSEALR